jgi:hypothetical protein
MLNDKVEEKQNSCLGGEGMAQVVGHLSFKHEAQSSNPSIAKNKAKQDK